MSRTLNVLFGKTVPAAAVNAQKAALSAAGSKLGFSINPVGEFAPGTVVVGATSAELSCCATAADCHSSITAAHNGNTVVRSRLNGENTSPVALRDQVDAFAQAGINNADAVAAVKANFAQTLRSAFSAAQAKKVKSVVVVMKTGISANDGLTSALQAVAKDLEGEAAKCGVSELTFTTTTKGHNQMVMFPEQICDNAVVVVPEVNGTTADVSEHLFVGLHGGQNTLPTRHVSAEGQQFVSCGADEDNTAGVLMAAAYAMNESKLEAAVKKAVAAGKAPKITEAIVAGL